MKKILFILLTILFMGCQQIDNIIDYFAELTVSETVGTTDTVFNFEVNTNDEILGFYDNGEFIEQGRSYAFTFPEGEHEVSVETKNGATDSVLIYVNAVDNYITRFVINDRLAFDGGNEDVLQLNYPILKFNNTEYNLITMTPNVNGHNVITSYTDTERIVTITMEISDNRDTFLFYNDNMFRMLGFREDELDIENMNKLIDYMNYIEPEPDFIVVDFNLNFNSNEDRLSTLEFIEDGYILDGVETSYIDANGTSDGTTKTINLNISIEKDDEFIVMDVNMTKFFRLDITSSLNEYYVNRVMEILQRYNNPLTNESLLDIVYDLDPTNPVLVEMGYFE